MVAYSTKEAARILVSAGRDSAGSISHSQLKRWTDDGVIRPSVKPGAGRGTSRMFGFFDLVSARTLGLLLDDGKISSLRLRRAASAVYGVADRPIDDLVLRGDLLSERWIVTGVEQQSWQAAAAVTISLGFVAGELREAISGLSMPLPDQSPVQRSGEIHTSV